MDRVLPLKSPTRTLLAAIIGLSPALSICRKTNAEIQLGVNFSSLDWLEIKAIH